MKNEKQTKNPKKNRRAVRVALKRVLSVDEIVHYSAVAAFVGAKEVAKRILSLRGEVTVEEIVAMLRLASIEVEARKAGYCD